MPDKMSHPREGDFLGQRIISVTDPSLAEHRSECAGTSTCDVRSSNQVRCLRPQ